MSSIEAEKVALNPKPLNSRDLNFNCITACSLDGDDIDCLTECVTNYYQEVVEQ